MRTTAGGGGGVLAQPAKNTAKPASMGRCSELSLTRNGAKMFIRCLENKDGLRDLFLLATDKTVMCLKKRRLSSGFDLKGNQL
jgi:hypothetical protein